MSFEQLLDDLEALQKASPPAKNGDDNRIARAAGGDVDDDGTPDGEDDLPELDDEDEDEDEDEGEPMGKKRQRPERLGKAISLTDEDGDMVEAYDATEVVESLERRLHKAHQVIASQTALLKSFGSRLDALESRGAGRKSVLHLHEKPGPTGSSPSVPPTQLLSKALSAMKMGRLTSLDVATIESCLGRGSPVPDHLAAILQGN